MKSIGFDMFVFVVVYVVYHLSLFPSVPGGDSGELLAEACVSLVFGVFMSSRFDEPLFSN
jgi:hypothetical protein